jgi:hypothetical protein
MPPVREGSLGRQGLLTGRPTPPNRLYYFGTFQYFLYIALHLGCAGSRLWTAVMARTFKVGDHVSWNSEVGRVRGLVVRIHTKDVDYKGYIHHASPEAPQYEIKSDKTEHVALHKGRALRRLSR